MDLINRNKLMLTFIVLFFIVHSIWDDHCCCHILSCYDACSCWFVGIHDVAVIMFLWANLKWHFDGVFMLNGGRICHPPTYQSLKTSQLRSKCPFSISGIGIYFATRYF